MQFVNISDKNGNELFTWPIADTDINITNDFPDGNATRFSNRFLNVIPRETTIFTRDLTSRDDVLLALVSLLLLLAIEGIVATLLLRTASKSSISSFAFSVKLLIELLRDLHLPKRGSRRRALSSRLVVAAVTLLTLVFGLEVLILFLSEPIHTPIYNTDVSFRILQPLIPSWNSVHFQTRSSLDRPCSAISMQGVEQGRTRITTCVTANITGLPFELFEKLPKDAPPIDLTITSDVHRYGIEHKVELGDLVATYSSRAYYSLDDGEARLMSIKDSPDEELDRVRIQNVHRQYVAYLCTLYKRSTKDKAMDVSLVETIKVGFDEPVDGPPVKLARRNKELQNTTSTRYVSRTTGKLPRGSIALRVAQNVFRTAVGVHITTANTTDFFLREGAQMEKRAVVWREEIRPLNLVSLCIMLGMTVVALGGLRVVLEPVSTADIASAFVKKEVGADGQRSPMELAKGERARFRVRKGEFNRYRIGAATGDGRDSEAEDGYPIVANDSRYSATDVAGELGQLEQRQRREGADSDTEPISRLTQDSHSSSRDSARQS